MKILKNFNKFISENVFTEEIIDTFTDIDILESIITDTDSLLNSIQAEEFDLYSAFDLDVKKFKFETIEDLHNNEHFNKVLNNKDLKKENIESTTESETFLDKAVDIKFFLIHKKDDNQLSQPIAIIFQSKSRKNNNWEELKAYKVNQDMKRFYDKLSSKIIEIEKGDGANSFAKKLAGFGMQVLAYDKYNFSLVENALWYRFSFLSIRFWQT